jgi:hypothetical protein
MRLSSLTCAAAVAVVGVLAPAGSAAASVTTANKADVGLLGASDPTYDGAFRQSLGLLAEKVAGVRDTAAITWLVNQQCPDGGWTAYRSDLSKPCPATDLSAFTGEDSNSTALAVQALHQLGVTPKYDALAFLHSLQDSDGGFPLIAGSGTDPNSTALVVQAIQAAGQDPTGASWTKSGHTPVDALMASWVNCPSADAGAFASPYSSGHGDLVASVQAVWGVERAALPITSTPTSAKPAPDCSGGALSPAPVQAGQYAATWLANHLTGGYLTTGSSPDYSLTAQGVLAMVASGTNSGGMTTALNYLSAHATAATRDAHGNVSPGALGYIALAAHAAGRSVTSFGGVNLVSTLQSSRRALPVKAVEKPVTKPVAKPVTQPVTQPAGGVNDPATLPTTGSRAAAESMLGFGCLAAGLALMLASRRRWQPRHKLGK